MKKSVVLFGLGVMALSLTSSYRLHAQRGEAQLGDNVVIIVPDTTVLPQGTEIVVTGPAKAPKAVGTCGARGSVISDPSLLGAANIPTQVAFYDADVVPRTRVDNMWIEGKPTGKTEVAILWPGFSGFKELKTGWHLGKNGDKGRCGPGYMVILSNIIAGTPGPQNRFFEVSQKK